jgi:hypothetical protein
LLLKIYVITGWPLPELEIRKILADQFEKLLLESYFDFTSSQIEFAFRSYGSKENFGKEMNLGFIRAVLDEYKGVYQEAQRYASESPLNASGEHIFSDEDMDNEIRGKIQSYLGYLWEGIKSPLYLPHWSEILIKDGFIKFPDQATDFFDYCLQNQIKVIYVKD